MGTKIPGCLLKRPGHDPGNVQILSLETQVEDNVTRGLHVRSVF